MTKVGKGTKFQPIRGRTVGIQTLMLNINEYRDVYCMNIGCILYEYMCV